MNLFLHTCARRKSLALPPSLSCGNLTVLQAPFDFSFKIKMTIPNRAKIQHWYENDKELASRVLGHPRSSHLHLATWIHESEKEKSSYPIRTEVIYPRERWWQLDSIRTSYIPPLSTHRVDRERETQEGQQQRWMMVVCVFNYPLFETLSYHEWTKKSQPHGEISPTQLAALEGNTEGLTQFAWAAYTQYDSR
jgi:hypothetical protein